MRVSRLKLSRKKNPKSYFLAPFLLFLSRFRRRFFLISPLFIIGALSVTWQFGYIQSFYDSLATKTSDLLSRCGYRFHDIYIQGRTFTTMQEILQAVNMYQGDPSFKYSPSDIKNRLEQLPWIAKADVRRELPGALHIHMSERKPIALWQHQQRFYLVDEEGIVIQASMLPQFQHLPIVVGQDAPLQTPKILAMLGHYKEILTRITGIVRMNKRRWDLILHKKLTIKLPETQVEAALARLNFLLEAHKINLDEVTVIDLRLQKQLIAKVSPHAAARLKLKGVSA